MYLIELFCTRVYALFSYLGRFKNTFLNAPFLSEFSILILVLIYVVSGANHVHFMLAQSIFAVVLVQLMFFPVQSKRKRLFFFKAWTTIDQAPVRFEQFAHLIAAMDLGTCLRQFVGQISLKLC